MLVAELGNTTDALDPDFRQDMLAYNASDAGTPRPCCPPGNGCHTGCCPCPKSAHVWGPRPERFNALFVHGKRQISARFPNGNPEDITGRCFSKTDWPEEGTTSAPVPQGCQVNVTGSDCGNRGCNSFWGGVGFAAEATGDFPSRAARK